MSQTKQTAQPTICPYCGSSVSLVDSKKVYRGRSYGPAYVCDRYPECDSYVGCHPGTMHSLGRLANAELRHAKIKAHHALDKLWGGRRGEHGPGIMKRSAAYRWLAKQMGLEAEGCHIGEFTVEQCEEAARLCQERMRRE